MRRQDHRIGARLKQLLLRGGFLASGDDLYGLVEAAGAERDKHIERIGGDDAGERAGPLYAGCLQGAFLGRIRVDIQISMFLRFLAAVHIGLKDDEFGFSLFQLLRQHLAQPTVAADDDMFVEVFDLLVHPRCSKNFLQLVVCYELHERAGQVNHAGTADYDQNDRNRAQRDRVDRPHLFEADGEHRQDDHV